MHNKCDFDNMTRKIGLIAPHQHRPEMNFGAQSTSSLKRTAEIYLVHFNGLLLLAPISIEGGARAEPEIIAWA
jgi:hypothetical protein